MSSVYLKQSTIDLLVPKKDSEVVDRSLSGKLKKALQAKKQEASDPNERKPFHVREDLYRWVCNNAHKGENFETALLRQIEEGTTIL